MTWNSGEVLAITLTDQDLNKNTWLDEDLTLADPSGQQAGSDLIPSMQIGSPLVLKAPPVLDNQQLKFQIMELTQLFKHSVKLVL